MCNNNLAAPQSKFETSIFLWKSRYHIKLYSEGLPGVQIQNKSDNTSYRRALSIYRKEGALSQRKIRGASEKFKNQPRPLLRPRSINFCQHFWNLSRETVPLKSLIFDDLYLCTQASYQKPVKAKDATFSPSVQVYHFGPRIRGREVYPARLSWAANWGGVQGVGRALCPACPFQKSGVGVYAWTHGKAGPWNSSPSEVS